MAQVQPVLHAPLDGQAGGLARPARPEPHGVRRGLVPGCASARPAAVPWQSPRLACVAIAQTGTAMSPMTAWMPQVTPLTQEGCWDVEVPISARCLDEARTSDGQPQPLPLQQRP